MIRLVSSLILLLTIGVASVMAGERHYLGVSHSSALGVASLGQTEKVVFVLGHSPQSQSLSAQSHSIVDAKLSIIHEEHKSCEDPDGHSCSPGFGLTAAAFGQAIHRLFSLRAPGQDLVLRSTRSGTLLRPPILTA